MDELSTATGSMMTSTKTHSTTVISRNDLFDSYIDGELDETNSYSTIFRLLLKSSIPKILSSFVSLFIITVNIICIGHHSTSSEFAGALLGITLINISLNIGIMTLTTGLDKFFNYSYKSQLYKMVGTFIQRYILIIHIIMAVLALILYFLSKDILIYVFGQTLSNAHNAERYIKILMIGFWPISMFALLRKYIESFSTDKHNIFIFVALLIAVLVEIAFGYLLLNKYGLSIEGAAMALTVAYWTAFISLYIISLLHPNIHENVVLTYPGCGHWIFNMKEMKIYLKHSVSKSIYIIFEMCMLELFVFIAGKFNTEYLCAYVISLNILKLFQRIPYAISFSSLLLIKERLYSVNRNAARRVWNASILLNIISICILTAVMLYFGDGLSALYTSHHGIVEKVKKTLPFTCLFFCFESLLKCFLSGMHGLHREQMTTIIYILCYYCFGFPLGIVYGYKGFLSIKAAQFKHINGIWLGASFGVFVSLCIFIFIRLRIDWVSEVKRSQKLIDALEIKVERFRNRVIIKYGRYSNYGIHSSLIDDDMVRSQTQSNRLSGQYDWTASDNIHHRDDSQRVSFAPSTTHSDELYNYYDQLDQYKHNDINDMHGQLPITSYMARNYGSGFRIPINDVRIGPYSAASSMARSIPQSIGPPSTDVTDSATAKHGPIVL